jgi:hypothetical protein
MNRNPEIAGHILNILADWDAPADEAVIHAQVNNRIQPAALLSEFKDAIKFCEFYQFITGVLNPLHGTRWSITDKGRAQRHA